MYLIQNDSNRVVTRFRELSTLTNPSYLFQFTNGFDNKKIVQFTTDNLNSGCAYEIFEIDLNLLSGSTTGGTSIPLSMVNGEWRLKVYEASAQTTSISATTGSIIMQDKVVIGTTKLTTF